MNSNHAFKIKLAIIFSFLTLYLLQLNIVAGLADSGENLTTLQRIGKGLGVFTAGLLVIGFSYVLLNRGYVILRTQLPKTEENLIVLKTAKEFYAKYRKPLFYVHVSINTLAIFFGIVHGMTVLVRNQLQADLGWLAIGIMILSSISGFIMWHKIHPIWDNKDMRSMIRASHRQWILTSILIVVLFFHVIIGHH